MKCANILTGLLLFSATALFAQVPSENICTDRYCSFSGADLINIRGVQSFASEDEARMVMNDIVQAMGLHPNFVIQAASVPNAAAWINNTQRYILYNPAFIQSVRASTHTDWSAISILAHEIGHHLNGHTLTREGSRPATELEADEFSGFVLRKMGASLDESQAAMRLLASTQGSTTHPPRHLRLQAIQRGWARADEQLGGGSSRPVAQTPPRPAPDNSSRPVEPAVDPEPEPVATATSNVSLPPYALWKVTMASNPGSEYYITKSHSFVVVKNSRIFTLGEFRSTQSQDFPFVIHFKDSPQLRVDADGQLYSADGANIGFLKRK